MGNSSPPSKTSERSTLEPLFHLFPMFPSFLKLQEHILSGNALNAHLDTPRWSSSSRTCCLGRARSRSNSRRSLSSAEGLMMCEKVRLDTHLCPHNESRQLQYSVTKSAECFLLSVIRPLCPHL